MHPALIALPEDPTADTRVLEAFGDWCGRYTPLVATDRSDGILLDISGCAHLFGNEQKNSRRSPDPHDRLRILSSCRHRLDHRRGLGGGAFR